MCGEKPSQKGCGSCPAGSPPRMRGKELLAADDLQTLRITPACAGKRSLHSFQAASPWDHPRVCGEKLMPAMSALLVVGSPPRVRGKGWGGIDGIRLEGITPACAGKSTAGQYQAVNRWDHPRVCGEKAYSRVIIGSLWGSPPRVRGKVANPNTIERRRGITPACAGKSQLVKAFQRRSWDHPRVCGEKCS